MIKNAVVTGGSSGLGAAFVRALRADGWPVRIIDPAKPSELWTGAPGQAQRFAWIPADLSDRKHMLGVCEDLRHMDVGFLVNCAGFCEFEPFASSQRSLELIDLHCAAVVALTRAVLPGMLAAGKGHIVNVSSATVTARLPGTVAYSASKVFQVAFSEYLASELVGTGVTVQALCAPVMDTALWANAGKAPPTELVRDPDEVAQISLANLGRVRIVLT